MYTFLDVYQTIKNYGLISRPRGKTIIELENFQFTVPYTSRFCSFKARKFNLDYLKEEFMWYLCADPMDALITESAQMWTEIRQADGSFLSNYGVYWFKNGGFKWVIDELIRDKDSRRAVIPMLSQDHLFESNPDVVCTYSISFRIRKNQLNMTVNMRSQDAVWGMTNDIPCFSFLHEMVYHVLRDKWYHDLSMGRYVHHVDSLHTYERHFGMMDKIIEEGESGFIEITAPQIEDSGEVYFLMNRASDMTVKDAEQFKFASWLLDNKYRRQRDTDVQ